ncbi:MAG: transposase [Coxiellaceae bacterium]|nr:transposase [Coxiellaceae bacterium]
MHVAQAVSTDQPVSLKNLNALKSYQSLPFAVPNPGEFKNGRHMSAWLGLVPRQSSSGNKQVLLGISKRGDRYLRTLLIHGARAALSFCKNVDNEYGRWLTKRKATMKFNKAAVALANKNARIIWSLLNTGEEFNINNRVAA